MPSGTTYTWTVAANANVTGQSDQATGQASISQTLTNNTNDPQNVVYTVTPKSGTCTGATFTITVTVNPKPKIGNQTATICGGTAFTVAPLNGQPTTIVPSNTLYTWTVASNANVSGQSDQSTGQSSISQTLTNLTVTPQDVVYTVTPKSGSCTGATFTVTITVNPAPIIPAQTTSACSGSSLTFAPTNGVPTNATVVPANTTYTWTYADNTSVTGETNQASPGVSPFAQTLTNISSNDQSVTYTVTPKSGATGTCTGSSFQLTVTLQTKPVIPNQTLSSCSGVAFTLPVTNNPPTTIIPTGTTYTWTYADNANVTGEAAQATPVSSVTQTLTNTTNADQTIIYTVTPGLGTSCAADPFTMTVTLTPAPIIPNQTATICSGETFSVSLTNNPPSTVLPSGTTYTWTVSSNTNVTGQSDQSTGQTSIGQALTNNTNVVQTVVYTVTPKSGSCTGATFTVTVTVNPKPKIGNQTSTICSGDAFTVSPANAQPATIVPSGTTYTWTVSSNTNVTGQSDQSTGQTSISQTLTNNTNVPQDVVYTVTPKSGTCVGSSFTITVTVNPKPKIPTNQQLTICSGNSFVLPLLNNPTTLILPVGTAYSWTVVDNPNVTGESDQTTYTSNLSQTLTNNSDQPQDVIYTITPKSGDCIGASFSLTVKVNPAPYIPDQTTVTCSEIAFNVSPVNNLPNTIVPNATSYIWTVVDNPSVTGESNQATTQSSISQTLTNNSNTNQTVVYTVTPKSGAPWNCTGPDFTLTVTLNTKPVIPNQSISVCSGSAFSVPLTNNPPSVILPSGTTYTWTVVDNPNVSNETDQITPTINLTQTLINNTNTVQIVVYHVTPRIGDCVGSSFDLTVTVNPSPTIPNQVSEICSGNSFTITPANNPPGYIVPPNTTYTWIVQNNSDVDGEQNETNTQTQISQLLTNNTNVVQHIIYTVTPSFGGCAGAQFNIDVTVDPVPVIPDKAIQFCSGSDFIFNPVNNQPNVIVPQNTTYTWVVSTNGNVTGQSNSGVGQSEIHQTLTNNTNQTQVLTYTIVPKSGVQGNCVGRTITYTITIYPAPVFPTMYDTICSGSSFDTIPVNNATATPPLIVPSGTTYSWDVPSMPQGPGATLTAGTSGGQAQDNQTHIYGTLLNTAYNPLNVTYAVVPVAPISGGTSCSGAPFNYIVTVNPLPIINNTSLINSLCNEGNSQAISFTSFTNDSSFAWNTIGATTITGFQTSGTGNLPSMQLFNATDAQDTVFYEVVTTANGCAGPAVQDTIIVNPDARAAFTFTKDTACWPFVIDSSVIHNTSPNVIVPGTADTLYFWYAIHFDTTANQFIRDSLGEGYSIPTPPGYTLQNSDDSVQIQLVTISRFGCKNDTLAHWFFTKNDPRPDFDTIPITANSPCGPREVQFVNNTLFNTAHPLVDTPFTYHWDFGDGHDTTTRDTASISHIFMPDTVNFYPIVYHVTLTAYNECISRDTSINITVSSRPDARFAPDSTNACSNNRIRFTNTSRGYQTRYYYNFGDNTPIIDTPTLDPIFHQYNTGVPRDYVATLTAINQCGSSVAQITIHIDPDTIRPNWYIQNNTQQGCAPLRVVINNVSSTLNASFEWHVGSTTFFNSNNVINYTISDSGTYPIWVRVRNGCTDTTSDTSLIRVLHTPRPSFTIDTNYSCYGNPVHFIHTSDTATSFHWTFGDPLSGISDTSLLPNPSHVYDTAGNYQVILTDTLTNYQLSPVISCYASDTQIVSIIKPQVSIQGPTRVCLGERISYTPVIVNPANLSAIHDTAWYVDGVLMVATPTQANPFSYQFNVPGNHTIKLVATTISGCSDDTTIIVLVDTLPNMRIASPNDTVMCRQDSIRLSAVQNTNLYLYNWGPSSSGIQCSTCPITNVSPASTQTFVLTVTDPNTQCKSKDSVDIRVIQDYTLTLTPDTATLCIGDSIYLQAFGANTYLWTWSPSGQSTDSANWFFPTGNTIYHIESKGEYGCFPKRDSIIIPVGQYPIVSLPADTVLPTGTNYTIIYPFPQNGPGFNYQWTPSRYLNCDGCAYPVARVTNDICYRLVVTNIFGCKDTAETCIRTLCSNAQVFIPNAFTPTDNINNRFTVRASGISEVKSFKVYNRWGQLVYDRSNFPPNNYSFGWDGRINGQLSPPDVFVYTCEVICDNNVTYTYKGNVTLIR